MKNATIRQLKEPVFPAGFAPSKWIMPGNSEPMRAGFIPVVPGDPHLINIISHGPGPFSFAMRFKKSWRDVPTSVLNEVTQRRVKELGRPVGRKERRQIRDETLLALLPRAFVKHAYVDILVVKGQWLVVGTTNKKDFELVCGALREASGSLPAALPDSNPADWLTTLTAKVGTVAGFEDAEERYMLQGANGKARCETAHPYNLIEEQGLGVVRMTLEDPDGSFDFATDWTMRRIAIAGWSELMADQLGASDDRTAVRKAELILRVDWFADVLPRLLDAGRGLCSA